MENRRNRRQYTSTASAKSSTEDRGTKWSEIHNWRQTPSLPTQIVQANRRPNTIGVRYAVFGHTSTKRNEVEWKWWASRAMRTIGCVP